MPLATQAVGDGQQNGVHMGDRPVPSDIAGIERIREVSDTRPYRGAGRRFADASLLKHLN